MNDRSMHAGISAPQFWGPGPWDDEVMNRPTSWIQRSREQGDLRAWPADEPRSGGPVVPIDTGRYELKGTQGYSRLHRPRDGDTVSSLCWCGRTATKVPVEWVRECRTSACDDRCYARYVRQREVAQ